MAHMTKWFSTVLFVLMAGVASVSLVRYGNIDRELWELKADREVDHQQALLSKATLQLRGILEGVELPSHCPHNIRNVDDITLGLDSLMYPNDGVPTLLLLFSFTGCLACFNQEIEFFERDSAFDECNIRVAYVCTDSAARVSDADLLRFTKSRHLKRPTFHDPDDSFRRNLNVQNYTPIEMVVVNRKIVYATLPSSSDPARSVVFVTCAKRLLQGSLSLPHERSNP